MTVHRMIFAQSQRPAASDIHSRFVEPELLKAKFHWKLHLEPLKGTAIGRVPHVLPSPSTEWT
jgi:hypothetical protein